MITLDAIKTEQSKIESMIATFEKQLLTQEPRTVYFPSISVNLAPGEHYAGIILGKDGAAPHHLILLPGEAESITWKDAKAWAAKAGGELPTRREQALLYANLKDQFQELSYWSCEQHAALSDYAWFQSFDTGTQHYYGIILKLRARSVRRLEI